MTSGRGRAEEAPQNSAAATEEAPQSSPAVAEEAPQSNAAAAEEAPQSSPVVAEEAPQSSPAAAEEPHPALALVTGFPHLLARSLVERGLQLAQSAAAPTRVVLLHHPQHSAQAQAFLAALPPEHRAHVEALEARLADIDMGLSGAQMRRLLAHTRWVLHADPEAQASALTQGRSHRYAEQLRIFTHLLSFALGCAHFERLALFSTAFVSGGRVGDIFEEELDEGQRLRSPYERMMFSLESLARAAMPRLPITVLRPGAMIGHSRTGDASGLTEGPNYLVRLMVRLPAELPLPLPGSGGVPFNIVPIDYVVHAAWALLLKPEAAGRTLHLTDPNPLSARQAFELLADLASRPTPFTGRWAMIALRRLLRLIALGRWAPEQMALFEDLNRHVTYQCGAALALLSDTGIVCPPFETYADTLVAWISRYERQRKHAPHASAQDTWV